MTSVHKALFYILIFASIGYATWRFFERAKFWKKGKPITWKPAYLRNIFTYILAQKKVANARPKSGAPMHLLIFFGFLSLLLATSILAINTYGPWKFHHGTFYVVYEALFDTLGLFFVFGVAWAIARRSSFRLKVMVHEAKDAWALWLLFGIGFTGYLVEAARIANTQADFNNVSWVGFGVSKLLGSVSDGAYVGIWWVHAVLVMTFIATLPHMRLKHIVMAVASAAGSPEKPMGHLVPISMEEVESTGKIGVNNPADFDRWHLMSLDACMECGRCTEVCPANGAGKSLDPRAIVQGVHKALTINAGVVETVSEEALWACTTCNACVEVCPVLIRHVDLIVDARRFLVAEGKLSGTAATVLRQTASTNNAWGVPATSREDWMQGLTVPLAKEKKQFDYLFWVGCAGATDPGAIRTTKAVAKLLTKAGIDFACLGQEEACTGDPARRLGDEFLFQEKAGQNVSVFAKYEFKKIVTACPHCLNSLRTEYPDFEGKYEVVHHTQLIADLIKQKKLNAPTLKPGEVTYHDPCYLARVNDESDAPRAALGQKSALNGGAPIMLQNLTDSPHTRTLAEPEHYGRKTLCCGAGGGRMWMEEEPDQRPGNRRAEELLATGAKTVAVGCPFCRIMLDASVKQVSDAEIDLVDVAEIVLGANE